MSTVVILALAVTVVVVGQPPVLAAPATADWRLEPQVDPAVPARSAPAVAARGGAPAPPLNRPPTVWPTPATADVAVAAAGTRPVSARVGGLPVRVAAAAGIDRAAPPPGRVRVEVLDRTRTGAAGFRGVMLRLGRLDAVATGRARITVDYTGFRHAYGADWGLRLRLVEVPECALTDPGRAGCHGRALPTANDTTTGTVSADLDMAASSAQGTLIALEGGTSSGAGSYAATSLQPSSTWSVGGNSGGFAWSYPMRMPPSLGGPAPSVALSYSSQSVDGRMAASNNQPSWIGEGFDYSPGFIERRYKPCSEDTTGGNNGTETGDLCWVRDNATMSLNGSSNELLVKSGNEWRGRHDDATRVVKATGGGNGTYNGEYWVATTTDGTRYFFGSTPAATWTVPVFGNHRTEPCNRILFVDSDCTQAWRWMLDKVIDRNGNTMTLSWVEETNRYARDLTATDAAEYTRGGWLRRIEYGGRDGVAATAPVRVEFTDADRCVTASCGARDGVNWPDVAWDQQCTGSPCTVGSPTFWTTRRLSKVTTQLWVSGSTYRDVEWWTLSHSFPDPGDGTRAGLWLDRISHAGKIGTITTTVPDITFDRVQMPNRVDPTQGDWAPPMIWWRISQIHTETGGSINVTYDPAECYAPGGLPAAVHTNTKRCYPVRWTPPGNTNAVTDWFHQYTVDTITESDLIGGANPVVHRYEYLGGGAWHYTDDALIADEDKTWSVWRGYPTVRTTTGAAPDTVQVTETRYFRGMHGDRQPTATRTVALAAVGSYAPAVNDEDHFAGMARETVVYNGAVEVSGEVHQPWRSAANATRTIDGVTVTARHVRTTTSWNRTTLDGGRAPRITATTTTFDEYGLPDRVEDAGDIAVPGDERCALTVYARDTSLWLIAFPQQARSLAVGCATATNGTTLAEADVLTDVRTWYDQAATFGTAPTKANVSKVETLKTWTPGPSNSFPGGAGYLVTSTHKHDAWGRETEKTDVKNNKTTTAYAHNGAGQLSSATSSNHLTWTTTTTLEPAWALPTKTVDPNGRITELTYDGLGRLTGVWLPGRDKAGGSGANLTFAYNVRNNAPTVVSSAKLIPGGYVTTRALYDGLLRPRQTQTPEGTTGGGRIVTDTLYDTAGRAFKNRGPYIAEGAPDATLVLPISETAIPAVTTSVFDGAGRISNSIFTSMGIEKWRTTTRYGGDRTDVTPPPGGTATSTVTDARGNAVKLYQYHGATPTPGVAGSWDETRYTVNRKDQLTQVQDPAGNRWTYGYDLRGRQNSATDPDKGLTTSVFNDAGELTSVTDARGEVLAYTYDTLGRKTSVRDDTATGPKRAEWVFDTAPDALSGNPVKGQLAKAIRYELAGSTNAYVQETVGYNTNYTPTDTAITIPTSETGLAGTYTYNRTYWEDGSPSILRLPDVDGAGGLTAENLSFRYNHLGLPDTLRTDYGGTTTDYVVGTTYTRYGEPTLVGLAQPDGGIVEQARQYETGTRRLNRIITSRITAPSGVADLNFSYDPAGNLTKIADLTPNPDDTQCFAYDRLRRLTEAWTPLSGDCAAAPSLAGLGGPAPYWYSWTFDVVGNRKTQVEHGATNTTRTYTHPAAGAAKPHTLTSMTSTGGASGTLAYAYDATGNTTCRPAGTSSNTCPGGAGSQTLTWDPEGHLATSVDTAGATSFVYDADGNRLIRRDPTGKTAYLPGQELRYTTNGGTRTCTRYYTHNGIPIASRTATALTWISGDHQNTAGFAFTASGSQPITTRRQTPYGTPRGGVPAWPNPHGFVDGVVDNTGLTHLGAREYDPAIGRFISVDPIQDLTDPQQWHGYAYASNNPVTLSDPDGLLPSAADCGPDGVECPGRADEDPCKGGCGTEDLDSPAERGVVATTRHRNGTAVEVTGDGRVFITVPNARPLELPCTYETCPDLNALGIAIDRVYGAMGNEEYGVEHFEAVSFVRRACENLRDACSADFQLSLAQIHIANVAAEFQEVGPMFALTVGAAAAIGAIYRLGVSLAGGAPAGAAAAAGGRSRYRCDSFDQDTEVLMADGTVKRIEDVEVGDVVMATDPETGQTVPRRVTEVHRNIDTDLVDVIVAGRDGRVDVLHTTEHHPFWDETDRAWVDAGELVPGHMLRTADEATATVVAVRRIARLAQMYNLTVDADHTYYVLAGNTPLLVHNTGPSCTRVPSVHGRSLAYAEAEFANGGFTFTKMRGAYRQYDNPDGSQIFIRPNGEVMRLGPKVDAGPNARNYRQRYGPDGELTNLHSTGEIVRMP